MGAVRKKGETGNRMFRKGEKDRWRQGGWDGRREGRRGDGKERRRGEGRWMDGCPSI